jgi:hypothetical protein
MTIMMMMSSSITASNIALPLGLGALVGAAADLLVGEVAEPALDLVDPEDPVG